MLISLATDFNRHITALEQSKLKARYLTPKVVAGGVPENKKNKRDKL